MFVADENMRGMVLSRDVLILDRYEHGINSGAVARMMISSTQATPLNATIRRQRAARVAKLLKTAKSEVLARVHPRMSLVAHASGVCTH